MTESSIASIHVLKGLNSTHNANPLHDLTGYSLVACPGIPLLMNDNVYHMTRTGHVGKGLKLGWYIQDTNKWYWSDELYVCDFIPICVCAYQDTILIILAHDEFSQIWRYHPAREIFTEITLTLPKSQYDRNFKTIDMKSHADKLYLLGDHNELHGYSPDTGFALIKIGLKAASQNEYVKAASQNEYVKAASQNEYVKAASQNEYVKAASQNEYVKGKHLNINNGSLLVLDYIIYKEGFYGIDHVNIMYELVPARIVVKYSLLINTLTVCLNDSINDRTMSCRSISIAYVILIKGLAIEIRKIPLFKDDHWGQS
jgi:hypothetical protein